jgi:hypothetical protein
LLARWVAGAADERLEAVMRGPLRVVLLWQIFATMRQRFDPGRAPRLHAVVEFRIRRPGRETVDRYQVTVTDERCTITIRGNQPAAVALEMGSAAFLRLVGGAAAAPGLLLKGKLKVRGDLFLATRLPRLLNIPRPPDRRT